MRKKTYSRSFSWTFNFNWFFQRMSIVPVIHREWGIHHSQFSNLLFRRKNRQWKSTQNNCSCVATTTKALLARASFMNRANKQRLKIHDLVLCNRRCDSFTSFYDGEEKNSTEFYAINRDTGLMLCSDCFHNWKCNKKVELQLKWKKCAMTSGREKWIFLCLSW